MSDITFYFIRHGYSCSNLNKKRKNKINLSDADSHLTNWGIISSIFAGEYLKKNFFNNISFDYVYCSPFIRTWETAACMFSDKYNNFLVGPHLSEKRKDKKKSYTYQTNKQRFKKFINFVASKSKTSLDYIIKNTNNTLINNQIENVKKFNILYSGNDYSNKYYDTDKADLEKFINWFIKNNKLNKKTNVLIICHNKLMIDFLDKHSHYSYYKQNIKNTNNFSFSVNVKNKKIGNPIIFFFGIKNPIKYEDNIDIDCSLCVDNRICNQKDKELHLHLINNQEKYMANLV